MSLFSQDGCWSSFERISSDHWASWKCISAFVDASYNATSTQHETKWLHLLMLELFVHLTMLCVFTLELHIVVNYVILMSEAFCSNLLPLLSTINRFVVIISFICMKHICCFPLGSFGLAHHLTANAIWRWQLVVVVFLADLQSGSQIHSTNGLVGLGQSTKHSRYHLAWAGHGLGNGLCCLGPHFQTRPWS